MAQFRIKTTFLGTELPTHPKIQQGPSVTMLKGDAMKYDTTGRLILCTAADKADFISAQAVTSDDGTTGNLKFPLVYPGGKGLVPYETDLVLLLDAVAATVAGSTTTCTMALTAGSTGDLIGGFVRSAQTGDVRRIINNTYSGGNVVITILEPWSSSYAAPLGDKFSVNAFGPGDKALKFGGTRVSGGVSKAIADRSGGNITCIAVDMLNKVGTFTFNP